MDVHIVIAAVFRFKAIARIPKHLVVSFSKDIGGNFDIEVLNVPTEVVCVYTYIYFRNEYTYWMLEVASSVSDILM